VSDAAARLGGQPVGLDALGSGPAVLEEAANHASRSWRRATSGRAPPDATRRSSAPTTRRPRARGSMTRRSGCTRGWAGSELQPAVQPVRAPHARPHRPRAVRHGQPRGGQPPQRDRLATDRAGRRQGARARDIRRRRDDAPDPRRALPPARRDHPPRRRGVGLRARCRRGPRGDPPVHGGHGARTKR
jgi:hypothetical protein